jgi:hypothetical protein
VENLNTAIEEGGQIKSMVERLGLREAELRDAQAALEHLDGLEIGTKPLDEVALLEELVDTIKALRDNLDGDPARGRQVMKRLLQTPIAVGPDATGGWSFKFGRRSWTPRSIWPPPTGRCRCARASASSPAPSTGATQDGAPGVTRTPGTQFRKLLLCPPELRGPSPILRACRTPVHRRGAVRSVRRACPPRAALAA